MRVTCPACGRRAGAADRFCAACGGPLTAGPAAVREERKTVSVVFADIVGWTEQAERLDPEQARALLARHWEPAREEIEARGGTVEKFIGDAVVGLFGAPAAHEDDAERAARSALAIRDRARDVHAPGLRIAVATGPALVRLGAVAAQGEAMVVGDVLNTGARLQALAPVGGVLVDEATFLATRDALRYRRLSPVSVKGKTRPVAVWEALDVRGPPGRHARLGAAFVGRSLELSLLGATFERVVRDRAVQLVTLVGAPGIGKSRLVEELARHYPEAAWWAGRSLPYGDGLTFWAFAEAVKGAAGIAEGDGRATARARLSRLLARLVPDAEERGWLEEHARRLVGAADRCDETDRLEAFAAWRRLLEAAAARRPLVLALDDVQWADDGLLDLVEHLVEWAAPVPMLVLVTARPELLERRPGWGGGKPNALTLTLGPLTDDETALLLADVLGSGFDPALVTRVAGNPLYAEQFARMLLEEGGAVARMPDSVQGIVAARLDRLPFADKELLLDAAVVGATFADAAVGAVAGVGREAVRDALQQLRRTQLVAPAGDGEWAFAHRLVCEVAYGEIPRGVRAEKHLRLARWIEERDRLGDEAELVAHHYTRARHYRTAAGLDAAELDEPTRRALVRAGERALALSSFAAATRLHAQALELWPPGVPGRARVLLRHTQARWSAEGVGEDAAREACDALLLENDLEGAAEAETLLSEMRWYRGDRDAADAHIAAALALVRDAPASRAKALAIERLARSHMLAARYDAALAVGRDALALAEEIGNVELQADALNTIGSARARGGDPAGTDDVERAIAIAPNSRAAVVAWNNLASLRLDAGDREAGLVCLREGRRLAERLGDRLHLDWLAVARVDELFLCGEWTEALAEVERLLASLGSSHYLSASLHIARAAILHARGDPSAVEDARRAVEAARGAADPQLLVPTLAGAAFFALREGRREDAESLVDEAMRACQTAGELPPMGAFDLALVLAETGRAHEFARLLEWRRTQSRWFDVARLVADGDVESAAALADEIDPGWAAAYLHLSAARAGGDPEHAEQALAYYRATGASRYVREAEALLAMTAEGRRSRSRPSDPACRGRAARAGASGSGTSGG